MHSSAVLYSVFLVNNTFGRKHSKIKNLKN